MFKKLFIIFSIVMFVGVVALSNTANADTCSTGTTTLRVGSKGEEVKCLQATIWVTADGIFGPKTKAAVEAWQAVKDLVADGIFGANSRAVFVVSTPTPTTTPTPTPTPTTTPTTTTTTTPTVTIFANPTTIQSGKSSNLSWNSQNATSCSISLSGSQNVFPSRTTTYNITCAGSMGSRASASATVFVNQVQVQNPTPTLPTPNQTAPICGNNKLETGEECDDGNKINGDGCNNSCKKEFDSASELSEQISCWPSFSSLYGSKISNLGLRGTSYNAYIKKDASGNYQIKAAIIGSYACDSGWKSGKYAICGEIRRYIINEVSAPDEREKRVQAYIDNNTLVVYGFDASRMGPVCVNTKTLGGNPDSSGSSGVTSGEKYIGPSTTACGGTPGTITNGIGGGSVSGTWIYGTDCNYHKVSDKNISQAEAQELARQMGIPIKTSTGVCCSESGKIYYSHLQLYGIDINNPPANYSAQCQLNPISCQ